MNYGAGYLSIIASNIFKTNIKKGSMKQIFQNLSNGETSLLDVPCPSSRSNHVLIKSSKSIVSAGTEKMLINFGKSNLIQKAKSQPDKVRMVIDKFKTDGLISTYESVKSKLDQPIPLGYCNVGTVIDPSDTDFKKGSRVVSNGYHSEVVSVSKNLIAEIPDNVDDESASFTVLGSIALQGIRLLNPSIGETVVVTGLGLIGLIAVQILKANGCIVIALDVDSRKCELAKSFGAHVVDLSNGENPITTAKSLTNNHGVDGVLITASSSSNEIIHQAADLCRKRGKIVLVGVVGMELNRDDFYEKELSFQVSCSYGPGRYDENYEKNGNDYPYAYVRWTEKRNFDAVLQLISSGAINLKQLITHRFCIEDALDAYKQINSPESLGIILDYKNSTLSAEQTIDLSSDFEINAHSQGNISFIGAGNYASRILIPAFKSAGANLITIVSNSGTSAAQFGKKNGFKIASTDINAALRSDTDAVVIATQHNLHAEQICKSLECGKHVFVEKPLALNHHEVDRIEKCQKINNKIVMVGFNRRFSPHIKKIKALTKSKKMPKTFIMTMNAGKIPKNHWTQNRSIGGGRIVGESCHYIDLMRHLAGSKIVSYSAIKMGKNNYEEVTEDKAIISLTFEDGSIGCINYFSNGGNRFPKERIEVFCDNAVLQLDNFIKLKGFNWKGFNSMRTFSQNKGQNECVKGFFNSIKNREKPPISKEEIFEVARVSIDIAEALRD